MLGQQLLTSGSTPSSQYLQYVYLNTFSSRLTCNSATDDFSPWLKPVHAIIGLDRSGLPDETASQANYPLGPVS